MTEAETATTESQRRRGMGRAPGFWLLGAVLGFLMFAAAAPTPMYVIYQARWHFTQTTLTIVFAVYALAVLAALITFGSVSDHLGRRPVLIGSLVVQIVAIALFAAAGGLGWLYGARIVQGLAVGIASGVIGAALIELAPPGRPTWGPLVNTVSLSAGLGLGAGVAGALVQFAPAPTVLTYLLLLGVFVLATAAALAIPEPVKTSWQGWRQALRPRKAAVPAPIRRQFAVASAGLVAAFAISGLYLSLGPSLVAKILHSHSHFLAGLAICVLFTAGAGAQIGLQRWPAQRAQLTGSISTVVGLGLTDYALVNPSSGVFFAGSIVLGLGFGLLVMGAFRTVTSLASPERRAEVTSAAYVVIYLSLAVPAVLAGLGTTYLGLSTTTLVFSAVVAVLAVLAGIGTKVGRPAKPSGSR